jgi:hypothetical protein
MQGVPIMLASLQHLAARDTSKSALQPLPPDLRETILDLELALDRERERARAAEERIRELEADKALCNAQYHCKTAELQAFQQKYARWEVAKAEYQSNPWAHVQDRDPFEDL